MRKLTCKGHSTIFVSTAHDIPATELIIHHTWDFLFYHDKLVLSCVSPTYIAYASLRYEATHVPRNLLRARLCHIPLSSHSPTISSSRARVLLLFHFDFGDLVRWLGGDYTHDYINHVAINDALTALHSVDQGPLYPQHNFDRVLHSFFHGVPDNAVYLCSQRDVLARNLYNNHSGYIPRLERMLSKIADDVSSHFMIAFLRWIWPFLYGFFISPLEYVQLKGKGRTVVDPTHLVNGNSDTGSLNSYLDKSDPSQVPQVFYQSAQLRHWRHIYNMRITHSREDYSLQR